MVKNLPANAGDARHISSIPGSEKSSGLVNGNTLQYYCLENSMDKGAWRATELWWGSIESDTTELLHTHKWSLFSAKEHPTCQSTVSKNAGDTWPRGGYSVQFISVSQSCLTLCNPMDCSTPGLPVHHQLPELAQTHVHRVSDAILPSYPLSSLSLPALNLSQHQGLFR